jgi:hypothetical protein
MSWLDNLLGIQESKPARDADNADEFTEKMKSIKDAGSNNGIHYTDNVEIIKQLKRDNKYDDAIELLLESIEMTEQESKKADSAPTSEDKFAFLSEGVASTWGVSPWYYEQLAIIYRKQKKYAEEVAILERYDRQPKAAGVGPKKLADRLINARELLASHNA